MDERLVAWARAVKSRRRMMPGPPIPVLWMFTDANRIADPLPAIARLPKNLCGVVFRDDGAPNREALGQAIAALCRARRIALCVAGDWRLAAALGAGVHLRMSQRERPNRRGPRYVTASAHNRTELRLAIRVRADVIFLSPVFATASHPGDAALGPRALAFLSRQCGKSLFALGGIDGKRARRLGQGSCAGAGAIGALDH